MIDILKKKYLPWLTCLPAFADVFVIVLDGLAALLVVVVEVIVVV